MSQTSLASLLATASPLLVLDAASTRVQVGLLGSGAPDARLDASPVTTAAPASLSLDSTGAKPWPGRWWAEETEATTGLFRGLAQVLAVLEGDLARVRGVIFCDGPGSILGIRTVAASVRAWLTTRPSAAALPVWRYRSLELVAHAWASTGELDALIVADARRDTWHVLPIDAAGATGPMARRTSAELAEQPASTRLITPSHFRAWSAPPRPFEVASYDVPALLAVTADAPLFTPAPEPDAFLHEEPSYKTWTPSIHQAPA